MKAEKNDATIELLDEILIDQIAAGEVVERPANAVKELIENALDAGAERVEVEIEDGGKSLIRITDDGRGMSPIDAERSIKRHATSKLRSFDDLSRLATLGFRGEALASIASVSRLSLRTRPHDAIRGTELLVEGGELVHKKPAGGAAGTTIEVRELFYNVPARQKFMKASQTEAARIHQIIIRAAMARPDVHFIYRNQGREIRSLPPALGVRHRAMALFPDDEFLEFTHVEGDLRFEALIAPERTSANRHNFFLFINERSVFDAGILKSVALGFPENLPSGRHPVGALYLHLPRHEVDINVHPQKTEVRLTDARRRLDQVRRAFRRALSRDEKTSELVDAGETRSTYPADYWETRLDRQRRMREDLPLLKEGGLFDAPDDRWGIGAALRESESGEGAHLSERPDGAAHEPPRPMAPARAYEDALPRAYSSGAQSSGPQRTPARAPEEAAQSAKPSAAYEDGLRGQTSSGHLLIERERALYIVDARAAIAALTLKELGAKEGALKVEASERRRLIFPARLEVRDAERVAADEGERLERLGFEVHAIGRETLAIRSMPAFLEALPPEEAVSALLGVREAQRPAALRELIRRDAGAIETIDEERACSIFAALDADPPLLAELSKIVPLNP